MKTVKASIPKGTRDFGPEQVRQRDYLFGVIRDVFVKYGFHPIETPTMENLTTLTGKYGEEGDQLLFKVLNNGDYLKKADAAALEARQSDKVTFSISKRGLRYDLTVPFARYVVQHQNELTFPFKRYQIQPVWRADRPQKGRYQEFYQCDVDVIGTDSLMCEAELIQIYDEVFQALGLKVIIRLNHRRVLEGIAQACGAADKLTELCMAIDKLDKFKDGWSGVCRELAERGIPEEKHALLEKAIFAKDLQSLRELFSESEIGRQGIEELELVQRYLGEDVLQNRLHIDFSLARGLTYYTGCVFEVIVDLNAPGQDKIKMGSIGGGGRYADLTNIFGLKNMPGVGVSFGAERIYDVMEELQLFPDSLSKTSTLLFIALDQESHVYAYQQMQQMRQRGIRVELYPKAAKMKKQMKYANERKFPYVGIIGEQERKEGRIALKDMNTGTQSKLSLEETIQQLQNDGASSQS